MDNATLVWINTVLLTMLGFCIVAIAKWFFSRFNRLIEKMASIEDLKRLECVLKRKVDEEDCERTHSDVRKYLHTHSKSGDAGEAIYKP